jgi:hypothetical protein
MGARGGIFRHADRLDMLLMLLGTLGSIGDGLQNPLTMLILSDVINDYGSGSSLTNDVVDKVVGTVSGTVTCCLVIRCLPRRSFSSRDL